jgi:hypothetical protein
VNPAAIIGACGPLLGVVLYIIGLIQALVLKPDLIVPPAYQAEQVTAKPVGPGQFKPDLAWPFYPFRQARADLARVGANIARLYGAVWRWPADAFFRGLHGSRLAWWIFFPIPLAVIGFLLQAGLAAWFCYLVYALVTTGCAVVNRALFATTAAVLRWAEQRRRVAVRTYAFCKQCFHLTPWPAYRCPGCSRLHRDVRPGRLGLFTRRCECGTLLPTMPLRAAWRLTPVCQRCGEELPSGTGAVRDIRIPIFGDTSAGKTRFLYASLNSLMLTARQAGIVVSFLDQVSEEKADLGLDLIRSGQDTAKTSADTPAALSCRLGKGRRSEFVHLFDAPGEQYRDAQAYESLRFLDHGQGLVYVLDPFSTGAVRDRLTGHNATAIRLAHAAAGDPEIAYGEVTSRLRDSGVAASTQRLAVLVSKADLLRAAGLELPVESGAIAEWLTQARIHNLVLAARRDFAEVRFFAVASQDVANDQSDDPGTPLRWLLRSHGVRLHIDPTSGRGGSDRSKADPAPSETAEAKP